MLQRHTPAVFTAAGQDAISMVGILVYLLEGTQTETNGLADLRIPSFEDLGTSCRCYSYQGKLTLPTIVADVFNLGSQEVTTSRAKFPKPVGMYTVLCIFGRNIVASEGEEWKRYRKIAAPAFSEVSPKHCPSPRSENDH
jgi:hypothetical protein